MKYIGTMIYIQKVFKTLWWFWRYASLYRYVLQIYAYSKHPNTDMKRIEKEIARTQHMQTKHVAPSHPNYVIFGGQVTEFGPVRMPIFILCPSMTIYFAFNFISMSFQQI